MQIMKFKPVFGYGWFHEGEGKSIDVPEQFIVEVIEENGTSIKGTIGQPHFFEGKKIMLSQRTKDNENLSYNVQVLNNSKAIDFTGFAELVS